MKKVLITISGVWAYVAYYKGYKFNIKKDINAIVLLVVKDFNHGILVNFKKLIQKKAPFKGCFLF